jgi:hypothetical protein
MISMKQFFADRGGPSHDGDRLIWGGNPTNNLPFRGNVVPDLRKDEIDNLDLAISFQSRMFQLWDEKEKTLFDQIKSRAAVGWYNIKKCEYHFDAEQKHYLVWMEWEQYYNELPEHMYAEY